VTRFFTLDYVERVVLHDGTSVLLRLLAPEDKPLLRRGFERLSAESRYARFLVPKQRLSDDELAYLCEIDQQNHFALGAIAETGDGSGDAIGLGIARFIRLPTRDLEPVTAEAAIAVADEAQGRGLGRLLFLRLCAAAAERDIEHFRCEVLCSNRSMHNLIAAVTPDRTVTVEGGVTTIDFSIGSVAPDAPASTAPDSPMYRFFRAAAEDVVEWTDAVRRLWRS
jgi:ribosomal protein S18 acetylase RimI-like enzyme